MRQTAVNWTQREVTVAGLPFMYRESGDGVSLLILPHETGLPPFTPFQNDLAQDHRVIIPTYPGFDGSIRADWMKSVRDLAVCIGYLIDKLKLHPSALIGLGFGGWVAAELATMRPTQFQYLALIGSFGLQPLKGEILDQFLLSHEDYVIKGFYDKKSYPKAYGGKATIEQLVQWDINREMTARIAWKPYMFSQTLSDLLCELDLLTLVAWGREDEIVPLECAHRLIKILPNARLKVYESAGHFLELEKPVALADAIRELNAVR